ncbi:glycosyltransferase family 1 protein [Cyanobium gracile UHCC 0139]|uniref:Glycosyltransferase family 1 protein n=1 Tax=Cyanobium gracile UHCC 0139 TaxID=3110308 RepID=A0ABU5RYG9_9CYAN|nr:glycosyltransferase family 1 protein [Cyanobium gracile]MEA5392815.1 glycosyltransferase family 1 protein [Cyanobium gracile UHCC 0139]
MTPMLPEGENGGAKILVLTLLKQLQVLAPDHQFILLVATWNRDELMDYASGNTTCLLVAGGESVSPAVPESAGVLRGILRKMTQKLRRRASQRPPTWLAGRDIDLLFCPFSAPVYAEPGIPTVAIVYDLQHLDYPCFFAPGERRHRTQFLRDLIQTSEAIICISQFSRRSLIQHLQAPPEQLHVVPIAIHQRWQPVEPEITHKHLCALGLAQRSYAFYPANYWPHKNHQLLLAAYSLYRQRHPDHAIDLVFTGASATGEAAVKAAVIAMGLQNHVHFLGYVEDDVLAAVWAGCECLIFPSLYEGFGIPLLEAMIHGKPILSSDAGSLPEVGDDAVLYFDPRQPEDLVAQWGKLSQDPEVVRALVERGRERLQHFGDEVAMTKDYLHIFHGVIRQAQQAGRDQ